jgi:hypothetical protein
MPAITRCARWGASSRAERVARGDSPQSASTWSSAAGSISSAWTFSAICAGEVAPSSTVATAGWASAKVDVIKAHPCQRAVEFRGGVLIGPELPPQLVRHDRAGTVPSRGSEQLAEQHPGAAGGDRRVAGLVVVPGVVEEVEAVLAGGAHHGEARVPADPLERPPGAQRQARDLELRASEPASLRHAIIRIYDGRHRAESSRWLQWSEPPDRPRGVTR